MPHAFVTIDTELMWRHHAAGLPPAEQIARSIDPAGVGVAFQLGLLAEHGLKACFFVDPMPALAYGLDVVKRIVAPILDAGQEVQLHLHPNWAGARAGDGGAGHARFELCDYGAAEQRDLIEGAADLLTAAGVPQPIAFRSGSYAANDDTLAALTSLGFVYDSSHNGSEAPWPSGIGLPARAIAPVVRGGLIECPVTLIEALPGRLRHFQICALSAAEMRAALDHAIRRDHAAVTIVGHGFELANRAGTRANAVHVRRFVALCQMLSDRADALPTAWYRDRPALPLGQGDAPLGPSLLRTRLREAEQLWSNLVAERAA
ncbi:polysaccharide deacetylase family protein [Sphingomonas baiyangensis]|uniref:Polysaccharide deacetylase n=1 Tax=Sphingomonas baiyangensis TaxID=2572576 RepID=A0A4V5PU93_9SPHN|nr:polysaccharide deacetylase [Sphingomonas baiyangensis]TKD53158.1 polysaccharide deacetylase [Sphingomonas baiyangensis]